MPAASGGSEAPSPSPRLFDSKSSRSSARRVTARGPIAAAAVFPTPEAENSHVRLSGACLRVSRSASLFVLLSFSNASAHCFVGARFFPATLATDDPCVADEMSLPTVAWSKTGDVPSATQCGHLGRHLQAHHRGFRHLRSARAGRKSNTRAVPPWPGFADLETTFQYQLLKDGSHELAMLLGLIVDWGGTGATNAGIGTSYSLLTPTYYFGQGFGQLPDTHRMGKADRGNRPDRLSDPDHVLHVAGRLTSRKRSFTVRRCNTACPTSSRK